MTLSEFIAAAYLKATGTVSTLTSSDDNWTKLKQLANYYQRNWVNEPGVDWVSRYNSGVSCGTVTATDAFDIAATIHKISLNGNDPIRIDWTDGENYTDYTLVEPDQLKYFDIGNYVAKVGSQLKFNTAFESTDAEFGGTIKVPAYTLPDELSDSADVIEVDDPNWLVTICAAEFARNDLVRQNQYPNLLTEANQLMAKMVENNGAQLERVVLRPAGQGRTW